MSLLTETRFIALPKYLFKPHQTSPTKRGVNVSLFLGLTINSGCFSLKYKRLALKRQAANRKMRVNILLIV